MLIGKPTNNSKPIGTILEIIICMLGSPVYFIMGTLISDGYECILVSDCTAARNSKIQQKIENKYVSVQSKKIIEKLLD